MRRFFIDPTCISGDSATIAEQEARHISSVLRLKPGSIIELFDGTGLVYQAEICATTKAAITVNILHSQRLQEHPPYLDVAQSLTKGKKMDLILQKATELGVSTLRPVISQHCDIKSVTSNQIDRWRRISQEACKQCSRPTPLTCHTAQTFVQFVASADKSATKFILWENQTTGTFPQPITTVNERVLIVIGPEGGFTQSEIQTAIQHGFIPVGLGPRILRAETAAIAAISILQFLLGNLQGTNMPEQSAANDSPRDAIPQEHTT